MSRSTRPPAHWYGGQGRLQGTMKRGGLEMSPASLAKLALDNPAVRDRASEVKDTGDLQACEQLRDGR